MKLQPALLFGEHMILQRREPIPVWGRSARDDTVTVTLGANTAVGKAEGGVWKVVLPPMEAMERTAMTITSAITGEKLVFDDVAIGEVWLAGGQSNMEFFLKYDEEFDAMKATPDDPCLRYFRYPQANFTGCLEKQPYPDDGFWRVWTHGGNRAFFSGPAAYMGRALRKALGVPVGFIGCNWGGTPAAAWTAMEDLEANPALKPILNWHAESCAATELAAYYAASDQTELEPTSEEQARMDFLMMGGDFHKLPPMPDIGDIPYTPFKPGPRACVRPAGLYETMLRKVAPYGIRGVIWYQGEDDDFRGWAEFYDESMKTMISSWRRLWGKKLPFLQVELAPFQGYAFNSAKQYPLMRTKQRAVADRCEDVHDVCIMDSGDALNIHVRKKRPVGERLALLARKYVYGEAGLLADSPRASSISCQGSQIQVLFDNGGDGLVLREDPQAVLEITADGKAVTAEAAVQGSVLLLTSPAFEGAETITVKFAEQNFCQDPLFNSAGLPAFPFTLELRRGKEI